MARLKKHPDIDKNFLGKANVPVRSIWNDPRSLENLVEASKWTDHIHFGGGEPLLDPRIWKFLHRIVRQDLSLSFVTNLSKIPDKKGIELLKSFKNIDFAVSIDATGDLYEWIRQGLKWKVLLKNLAQLRTYSISVSVNCEVQAHNILDIPYHYKIFHAMNLKPAYYFVTKPTLLQAKNAPKSVLELAIEKLPKNVDPLLLNGLNKALINHDNDIFEKLKLHTEYLNSFKVKQFDLVEWRVVPR